MTDIISRIALAQIGIADSVGYWAVVAIVVAAVIGILYVILHVMGVAPPDWIVKIIWILAAAFVGILAILLLLRMARGL